MVNDLMRGEKRNNNAFASQPEAYRFFSLSIFSIVCMLVLASFTVVFMVLPEQAAADAAPEGSWLGIDSSYLYSQCHPTGGSLAHLLPDALDGTDYWECRSKTPHWFIIDLGYTYSISSIRGRSNSQKDPTSVNIYISTEADRFEDASIERLDLSNSAAWIETSDFDTTNGRYVKVEIESTEDINGELRFGGVLSFFSIFDIFGDPLYDRQPVHFFDRADDLDKWDCNEYGLMADGEDQSYAYTTTDADVQLLSSNNCTRTSGLIVKVELRCNGYYASGKTVATDIQLIPVFGGDTDGDIYQYDAPADEGAWSAWFDITDDANGPGSWAWEDIASLRCKVKPFPSIDASFRVYCSKVDLRITYVPVADAQFTPSDATPDQGVEVTLDASDSDGAGTLSYSWDFDNDGTPDDTGSSVEHSFTFAKRHTVNLTVTDSEKTVSYKESVVTVKQKISVVNNSKNDGINYIAWGATASIKASELADGLSLDTGDIIRKFDPGTGDWSTVEYVAGASEEEGGEDDFTINRWDHVQIHTASNRSCSFTPDDMVDTTQQKTMEFNSTNENYNYITWSNDFSITPANFVASLNSTNFGGKNIEFMVYDSTTSTWKTYNAKYPDFATLTSIAPYDVICFRAPGFDPIDYDTDDWSS